MGMPRYFFHLRTAGGVEVTDLEGDELPDAEAAEEQAIARAQQLMRGPPLDFRGASFEVYEDANRHVVTVWFKKAAARPQDRTTIRLDDQHA